MNGSFNNYRYKSPSGAHITGTNCTAEGFLKMARTTMADEPVVVGLVERWDGDGWEYCFKDIQSPHFNEA